MANFRTIIRLTLVGLLFTATAGSAGAAANGEFDREICARSGEIVAEAQGIDRRGAFPGTVNLRLNNKVLQLAQCYLRNKDPKTAKAVAEILLRYGEAVRHWPVISRDGTANTAPDFTSWKIGGLWGGNWVYNDLAQSANLARAFELIASSSVLDDMQWQGRGGVRSIIRDRLLRYLVDFNLRFGRGGLIGSLTQEASFTFTNLDPRRLEQLIIFGRVVDPAYIHIAVKLLRQFLTVGFFRDGLWHEATVSYHRQVVGQLINVVAALKNYSDPRGFTHSGYRTLFGDYYNGVPGRFDNLDPLADLKPAFDRVIAADGMFVLPNNGVLTINDTDHGERRGRSKPLKGSACLFGVRHCRLVYGEGRDQSIVHLSFGGTDGHEHYDSLQFSYWANDRLQLSDGDYKEYSPRSWNKSTAAHNTVLIDRLDQDSRFDDREPLTSLDLIDGVGHHLWQGYGHGDSNNQGDLLAADLSGRPVQYIIADAGRSYDAHMPITTYQRTLVLVKGEAGSNYVIDIFRLNGGRVHDWMLHGDLSSAYRLTTNLETKPAKGSIGKYFKIVDAAEAEAPWVSRFEYADGGQLKTYHVESTPALVLKARAPAQKRAGDADYLAISKNGPQSIFVKVHVAQKNRTVLKSVKLLREASNADDTVRLQIVFASGRTDDVIIRPGRLDDGEAPVPGEKQTIRHVARTANGECIWRYDGNRTDGTARWTIGLDGVSRIAEGGTDNGFRLENWRRSAPGTPSLLHIRLPNGVIESYKITSVRRLSDTAVFVSVEDDPGLRITKLDADKAGQLLAKQLYYPSRGYTGTVSYRTTNNIFEDCRTAAKTSGTE